MGDRNNIKVKYMNECREIPFRVAIYVMISISMYKIDFKLNKLCYCSIDLKPYKSYLTPKKAQ